MKDLLLRACVVVKTSNMKISRRRLADYVKTLHQKACRTCSTIIFFIQPIKSLICDCRLHFFKLPIIADTSLRLRRMSCLC